MLNVLWLGMIIVAVVCGTITGRLNEVVNSVTASAHLAVELAIGLIGLMVLWMGILKVAEDAGLIQLFARALRPIMLRLFPEVPGDHPAMGAMIMNIAANMLGLANAATPFGLRAMKALETLNAQSGTATNAMCMFLAINTSSVQLIPTTAIAYLAAGGDPQPTRIIFTALVATSISTLVAIIAAKTFEKVPYFSIKGPGQ